MKFITDDKCIVSLDKLKLVEIGECAGKAELCLFYYRSNNGRVLVDYGTNFDQAREMYERIRKAVSS